jgi:hypothetical protein
MKPSRAMIPGEMSWAFIALLYVASALWPDSVLHDRLSAMGIVSLALWSCLLGIPALWLMTVSAREWVAHCQACKGFAPRWSIFETDHSAMLRGRLCLALLLGWAYMLYVIASGEVFRGAIISTGTSAGGCLFMLWFYKENRRVRREIRNGTAVAAAA